MKQSEVCTKPLPGTKSELIKSHGGGHGGGHGRGHGRGHGGGHGRGHGRVVMGRTLDWICLDKD